VKGFLAGALVAIVMGSAICAAFQLLAPRASLPVAEPTAAQLRQDFTRASAQYGVPAQLLEAICYFEGGMSTHHGAPSNDNGYGCMHLAQNTRMDTLARAADATGEQPAWLKAEMGANIAGGAAILRAAALRLSPTHTLPTSIGDWYGAVALYSGAASDTIARAYADTVYDLLNQGFAAPLARGDVVAVASLPTKPNLGAVANLSLASTTTTLPAGCVRDTKVDYPGAIDCILSPSRFDCNITPTTACNYNGANRPKDLAINRVVVHDIEGTAQNALSVFQNPNAQASAHYIVDSDGTVYQVIHEKDISYQAGNWWYNEHSIGIEHAGVDAKGYQWYNATEYLASAKLLAYLVRKYQLPLDHAHVVSHGTIPSPSLATSPNHVDPGPYWLWDYYFDLARKQGAPTPLSSQKPGVLTLHPKTNMAPYGTGGKETSDNFNFFKLYVGPSTTSGLIPHDGYTTDVTNITFNVEPLMSYYYVASAPDAAGTGNTMYQIWYGENDHTTDASPSLYADARLAWLAVPPGAAVLDVCESPCVLVTLGAAGGGAVNIYGRPTTSTTQDYVIGSAPTGAIFVSASRVIEDGTTNIWYAINFNHRQAWVPASAVASAG
jgi:N-acetyl-anhydromuramyl-L-alanine amidase AmpD